MSLEFIEYTIDNLNPTFLFTCKDVRRRDEKDYHSHDFPEMAFILSGEGRYHIDGNYYNVQEGDLILLNPGIRHQAIVTNPANPATEFFVGFCDVQFPGFPRNHLPLPNQNVIFHATGELRQKLFKLCTSMAAENDISREGRYLMLKTYLIQLHILLFREQCTPIKMTTQCSFDSANKKYVVKQMMAYFQDHYADKISLDQIAENMYLSPFYISRIFKSETGDTPIRHLINIRLERAKDLLESGWNGSIQEIASSVGYDDAYHFSKLFKKRYGVPPSQIRKLQK